MVSSSRNRRSRAWACAWLLGALVWFVLLPAGVASAQEASSGEPSTAASEEAPSSSGSEATSPSSSEPAGADRTRILGGHDPADGILERLERLERVERLGSAGPIGTGRSLVRALRTVLALHRQPRRGLGGRIRDDLRRVLVRRVLHPALRPGRRTHHGAHEWGSCFGSYRGRILDTLSRRVEIARSSRVRRRTDDRTAAGNPRRVARDYRDRRAEWRDRRRNPVADPRGGSPTGRRNRLRTATALGTAAPGRTARAGTRT